MDIISLKDYIRLPEQYSIKHWLQDVERLYLYVGSKQGLPFLKMKKDHRRNNTRTVVPLELDTSLELSLAEVQRIIHSMGIEGVEDESDSLLLDDEIMGISVLSCLNTACMSHIEDAQYNSFEAEWGSSVWQLSDTGKAQLLEHIDHCGDRESFSRSTGLEALVQSAKRSNQAAVILIGHNSVFCEPKEDLLRWFEPFDLDMLRDIRFKQPYIGILDLKTDEVEEFVGEDMVQVTF